MSAANANLGNVGSPLSQQPIVQTIRAGDTSKQHPLTICIIANPALEAPWNSNQFILDPIIGNLAAFNAAVAYIEQSLFGLLPNQREQFVNDPTVAGLIRVVSLFVSGLGLVDANSLAAQDPDSNILIARRDKFLPLLARFGLEADVAYAVSGSTTHTRASAWFTSDDDTRPGVPFTLDGVQYFHRYWCTVPGTVALPQASTSLTALHEFGHALSSYSNGAVTDLYVDSLPALNNKRGRPIPVVFGNYNGLSLASDQNRDGLGYPAGWQSYHCELIDPAEPAIMDDYWMAPGGVPEYCQHDIITREFLLDRLRAKTAR